MIQLFQYAPAYGLPNASPFCMKLETWLRMAKLPFENVPFTMAHFNQAPKGKLPYIREQGQGETPDRVMADSTLIIEHLKARHGNPLDAWLGSEQQAVALAFQRLLEENLYWAMVHARWAEPAGWALTRSAFFADMPVPLKWFVPALARRGMVKALHAHGMGRHSAAEITAIGQRDITALANFLADKPYFMGTQPCSLDATAHAFLANLLWAPVDSALKQHAQKYPQLEAYCQRMRSQYYSESPR